MAGLARPALPPRCGEREAPGREGRAAGVRACLHPRRWWSNPEPARPAPLARCRCRRPHSHAGVSGCPATGWHSRLGPEILHDGHAIEEGLRIGLRGGKTGVFDHGAQAGEAAHRPPFRLGFRLGEPFDVFQRRILFLGIGDDRNPLPAQLGITLAIGAGGVHQIAGLAAADIRVHLEPGPGEGEVHLQRDLTRLIGVDPLAHIAVGGTGRRAAIVKRLVELQPRDGAGGIDEARHIIGLFRVVIFEAEGIHHIHGAHGDALGPPLGVDRGAVDGLAVDLAALEEFGDVLEFGKGLLQPYGGQ